ncbi:hypothetical protein CFT13S00388_02630 [Campylobacter fetus subsp. testudinum]|uniref:hypothetical protein n=1 Tax=Campylobacter fetus TaxID=196 RepID=UPI00081898DB|nr:hypothetical protein [Campylobacter fetus]OCR88080.1 hypothetical protein CFT13S00388_02630 [Campylobacter fetus subsp. testudinum]
MAISYKTYSTDKTCGIMNIETREVSNFISEEALLDFIENNDDEILNGPFYIFKIESCGELVEDNSLTSEAQEKIIVLEELIKTAQNAINEIKGE